MPEWLEEFGYEDTHDDGPVAEDAAEPVEGASQSAAPRTAASPAGQCDCLLCRDRLTGDWCGYRSCLQENGIAYRGRVTQFFFGVGGGVNPPVPDQFADLGIGGGDTFEYTGNSRHDFLVDLDKFGGLPHSKFVVTMENLWGRWGNVSFETGGLSPAVFNSVMPVDPVAHGDLYCTNFMLVQPLSEQFIVTVGKTRTIGVADNNKFAGGDGSDQFRQPDVRGESTDGPSNPAVHIRRRCPDATGLGQCLSFGDGPDGTKQRIHGVRHAVQPRRDRVWASSSRYGVLRPAGRAARGRILQERRPA